MKTSVFLFTFSINLLIINGQLLSTLVNLENESSVKPSNLSTDKAALRYGFQKTHACKDYPKAFLCIRKCLDLQFDVAYSDKNCQCTCYSKPDKAKYTTPGLNRTRWRLGAPTTSKPIWAQEKTDANADHGKSQEEEKTTALSDDNNNPDGQKDNNETSASNVGEGNGTQTADAADAAPAADGVPDAAAAEGDAPAADAEGAEANPDAPAADPDAEAPAEGAEGDAEAPAEGAEAEAPAEEEAVAEEK